MIIRGLGGLIFFILLTAAVLNQVEAEEPELKSSLIGESTLQGRVIEINEGHRFAIINLGTAEGVKKGMVFSVFQKDEEVAKIKASKVRRHISACDIQMVFSARGIGVGDVAIYKPVPPLVKMFKPLEPTRAIEVEPIVVDIDAPKRTILLKLRNVFKDFGMVITGFDSTKYTLDAYKYWELPLDVGLLTDYGPFVRDKVYYNAEITTTPRYNRLVINLRGVYDREGQRYDHEINKTSTIYREAQEMAFTIKDLSEKL